MSAANDLSDVFIGCIKATHMVCVSENIAVPLTVILASCLRAR